MFGGYEWVVTENYQPNNESHVSLKEGIEVGNGLPTLATPAIIKANLEEAGFEVRSRAMHRHVTLNETVWPWPYGSRSWMGHALRPRERIPFHAVVEGIISIR